MNCKIKTNTTAEIDVFDIVTSPYIDINGVKRVGLFLVVYMEKKDPNDFNNRNITGLKLTSKDLYANVYRTPVNRDLVPALAVNSYVYANKVSTLLLSHCRFVAKLPASLCDEVLEKFNIYLQQLTTQTTKKLISDLKGGDKYGA